MTFYEQEVLRLRQKLYPDEQRCRQVIRAKKFIDTHFSETIRLDDMAGNAFLSKFHFIRQFKALYGRTPHQYLVSVRIERAKQFLRAGMPVTQACYAVGCDSPSSFTGLFKKETGLTPSQFLRAKKQFLRSPAAVYAPLLGKI